MAVVTVIPAEEVAEQSKNVRKNSQIRVAAYCRVSTDHEEQISSFTNQVEYYTNLICSNPKYEFIGIFQDEGISGTTAKKRTGFMDLIRECRKGNVDLILTKSISRFARNTSDCLQYTRELKALGVEVRFEKEGISTMDGSGELLFTILSSLAQEESRNISENTRWGIRSQFKKGIPHICTTCFMGYDKGDDGQLVINESQAVIVRRIYDEFLAGWSTAEIARHLREDNIPGVTGKCAWSSITIRRMLQNEKYKGDLRLQKWVTVSYLTKQQVPNDGQQEQYYVKNAHKAIITPEIWEATQQELAIRDGFKKKHQIKEMNARKSGQFAGKVYCGSCGGRYIRLDSEIMEEPFWHCCHSEERYGGCTNGIIRESDLRQTIVSAWNMLLIDCDFFDYGQDIYMESSELMQYRKQQIQSFSQLGLLKQENSTITRAVLREVLVNDSSDFFVTFVTGKSVHISGM